MSDNDHYTYRVSWSPRDEEFLRTCAEFPRLSWLDGTHEGAMRGIKQMVHDAVKDMRESGEDVPLPLADKEYSGNFELRIPPDLHRKLAIRAAECRLSLNRFIGFHLAQIA